MSEEDRRRFGEVGGYDQFAGNIAAGEASRLGVPRDGHERFPAEGVTATCLAHRQRVKWIPAPGWWIHVHDSGSCPGMRLASSPAGSVARLESGKVTGALLSRTRAAVAGLLRKGGGAR